MAQVIDVRIRPFSDMTWTEGTFPVEDPNWIVGSVHTAVCKLYDRVTPRRGGWGIGLWERMNGGHTAHVQMAARARRTGTAVSLQPKIIVQWEEHDDEQ